jgi:hypothetical protein
LTGGGTITFTLNFTATGTIIVNATLNGATWTGAVNYSISGPMSASGSSVPAPAFVLPGSYTLTYNSGGPPNATLTSITPSATWYLAGHSTITFTLNFTSPSAIIVNATLNGVTWTGTVNYSISGPTPISGSSVPAPAFVLPGSYTLIYNSGGPSGATLTSITPSATQSLAGGGTITFTLNFTR